MVPHTDLFQIYHHSKYSAAKGPHRVAQRGIGTQIFVDDDVVVLVEDADVHGSGVQIDAGIESVIRVLVETHQEPPLGWDRALARIVVARSHVLKLPRWDSTVTSGLSPFTTWDSTGPSQSRT
jgi:hypothetical protein